MARENNDPWKRFRDREDEDTTGLTLRERRTGVESPAAKAKDLDSERLENAIESTRTLIDQLNNLFNMYVAGVEERLPIEKRKLLDKTMEQLTATPKTSSASLFRFNSLLAHYNTYKDRWDRMLRDLESGKIVRRRAGGKR
jgi:hypothetical protein